MIKRLFAVMIAVICLAGCASYADGRPEGETENLPNVSSAQTEQSERAAQPEEYREFEAQLVVGRQVYTVILNDTQAAQQLYSRLPLQLEFEDFNSSEKIAWPWVELSRPEGRYDPRPGDLCLYTPWGNLALFYRDCERADGLVYLGHIEDAEDIDGMGRQFSAVLQKSEP